MAQNVLVDRADGEAEHRECRERHARSGPLVDRELAPHHKSDADKAECEADPLARRHPLAQDSPDDGGGQDGLQAGDQRRRSGRHPEVEGDENRTEIDRVNQRSGDQDMADLTPGGGPFRTKDQRDHGHEQRRYGEPDGQKGERLSVGQAELGEDVAGAPADDEDQRRRRDQPADMARPAHRPPREASATPTTAMAKPERPNQPNTSP